MLQVGLLKQGLGQEGKKPQQGFGLLMGEGLLDQGLQQVGCSLYLACIEQSLKAKPSVFWGDSLHLGEYFTKQKETLRPPFFEQAKLTASADLWAIPFSDKLSGEARLGVEQARA
jgi:hypothetical protein